MEYVIRRNNDELMHYGIPGMKWGVRRFETSSGNLTSKEKKRYDDAKYNYKLAKKEYDKVYKSAHTYSFFHPIGQFTNKKKREESNRRWYDTVDAAKKLDKAKTAYKVEKNKLKAKKTELSAKEYKKQKAERTKKTISAGIGISITGSIMAQIGKKAYNQYKNNSSLGKTAVINALGYGGTALRGIGDMMIVTAGVKSISDHTKHF